MIWNTARNLWHRRNLKQKITIGFGWVLGLFIITGILIHFGVGEIVGNAEAVIRGNQLDAALAQREVDHLNWVNQLNLTLRDETATSLKLETDDHKCGFGHWLYDEERRRAEALHPALAPLLRRIEEPHFKLHQSAILINALLGPGGDRETAGRIYDRQTMPALAETQQFLQEIRHTAKSAIMTDEAMLAAAAATERQVTILLLTTIVIGMFMARLTALDLSGLLTRISDTLRENAVQVAAASGEIASASTSLSEDASQQAAVVEETAASLASMSEGSRETAELTSGSEQLMRENIEKSGQSLKALVNLTGSMAEIERDSDKIRQIITTIDGIAFQTNLLALNAAVEAARAGEAGAGFAVVADEVLNLAHRAGTAAKDIAELLEATVKRVSQSSHALKNVNADFEGIIESATAIGDKNHAITQASEGFVHQIGQVNEATTLASDSTQRIASCAEETAAASEQLTAQAEELREMVIELVRAVEGEQAAGRLANQQTETTIDDNRRSGITWGEPALIQGE